MFSGPPFSGSYGPGGNGGANFPPNGPQGDFPGNMLPMSPGQGMNNLNTMNNMNSDMMNKPLTHSGQYPLSPPESTTSHLRHPPEHTMNNQLPSSSQSQIMNNHNSTNGTHVQQQQQQPSNNNVSSQQQQNTVGDDLNFDPTAIIDGDGSAAGLEVSKMSSEKKKKHKKTEDVLN